MIFVVVIVDFALRVFWVVMEKVCLVFWHRLLLIDRDGGEL